MNGQDTVDDEHGHSSGGTQVGVTFRARYIGWQGGGAQQQARQQALPVTRGTGKKGIDKVEFEIDGDGS